jgi:hypothetical protein
VGSSQTLVAPGLRTAPRAGWRGGVATAVAIVAAQPSLWLVGALGFAARGGFVVLALPMLIVPTPIEVRALLGDSLSSGGLTPQFFAMLVPVGAVAALLVLVALALAAQAELTAFDRLVTDAESVDQRDGREPRALDGRQRRGVLLRLFLVQCAALAALALAAVPLIAAIGDVTLSELTRPTSSANLYARVLDRVREPLFLLLPAVAIVEIFSAAASRRLLAERFGVGDRRTSSRRGGLRSIASLLAEPLRHPLRTIGTAVLAWTVSIGVLLPAAWALNVAADATRATFTGPRAASPELVPTLVAMTIVFVAVWVATVLLAGFVSAVRAALWTANGLR